jgi:L-alanine-DL-glutamate epimerase-like enolase superfamily enzyme
MRALQLSAGSAPIPFRMSFGHAAATRTKAENVLVRAEDGQGRYGLGEGCPRSYVTGEDVPGALSFIESNRDEFLAIENLGALRNWISDHVATINANPSAFCAVELALLDMFARQEGKSIEALLGIPRGAPVQVSAVYGSGGGLKFRAQAFLFARNGIHDAKLKLTGDPARDCARAKILASRGRVRLDANNLWAGAADAVAPLLELARYAWAIEEPVRPRDWEGLREIGLKTELTVILDESLLTLADLDAAPKDIPIVPNLRVSKLGGLIRSIEMLGRGKGDVIVGAQVGETSILARAGLALARSAGARLKGFECAYAPLLLTRDAASPSLGFGRRGVVRERAFESLPGLGLTPSAVFNAALQAR